METGLTALESLCTNGMKRMIDQTLDVPIGRKDGAAVKSMMKMHHLVAVGGMSHMMMASLCIRYHYF